MTKKERESMAVDVLTLAIDLLDGLGFDTIAVNHGELQARNVKPNLNKNKTKVMLSALTLSALCDVVVNKQGM